MLIWWRVGGVAFLHPQRYAMNKKYWIVNQLDNNTAEMLLYGYIGGDDVTASDFVRELKALENVNSKINIRINSGGGSVFDGFAIFNAIKNSKVTVETYIDGIAASMGSVIALAGSKVYMSKLARFMTHKPSGFAAGSANEMRQNAQLLEGLENSLASIYAAKTGLTLEQAKEKYLTNSDKWFTADEASTEGFVDAIYDGAQVEEPKAITDEKTIWNHYNQVFQNAFKNEDLNMKQFIASANIMATMKLGENATQADFEAAVNKLLSDRTAFESKMNEALTARITAESNLEDLKVSVNKEKVDGLIAKAIEEKKLTVEAGNTFKAQFSENATGLEAILKTMQPTGSVVDMLQQGGEGKADRAKELRAKTWDVLDKSGELHEFKTIDSEGFKAKYKQQFRTEYSGK